MALIRVALLVVGLVIAAYVIIAHGVRGLLALIVLAMIITVPRTRGWRWGESLLVRVTGSRRRAAMLAMVIVVGAMSLLAVLQFVH